MSDRPPPHLPQLVGIDAYGRGGFRFGGMSHQGSLLCLPSGIWAWPVSSAADITETSLAPVFAEAEEISLLLVGTGFDTAAIAPTLRRRLRELHIGVEVSTTGAAVRVFNIVLAERRKVAAALLATE